MIALRHYEIGQLILKSLWNISKGSSKTTGNKHLSPIDFHCHVSISPENIRKP